MKKNTDLTAIKHLAHSLLMTGVVPTEFSPVIVQHPFTSSGLVGLSTKGNISMIDITASEENLHKWQNYVANEIDKAESITDIYRMINKPYVMTFVKFAKDDLSKDDFSELLADAWIRSENPNSDANLSSRELVSMFRSADKHLLMDESEINQLYNMDDIVTVYRGVTPVHEKNVKALSWTLDYETACWFANRFGQEGTVYEATIAKEHILALFNSRNESEVIVDPRYLQDIEPVQEIEEGLYLQ